MNDVVIVPIEPKIKEVSDQIVAKRKRDNRRKYIKDNILSILALLISFLSLVISALALILPGRCECSQVESNTDTEYSYQDNLEDVSGDNQWSHLPSAGRAFSRAVLAHPLAVRPNL